MRHLVAIIVKAIWVVSIFAIMISFLYDYVQRGTVIMALVAVPIAYAIGDMIILPNSNNIIAALADLGLYTFFIWLLGPFFVGEPIPFTIALMASAVVSIGELVFHRYIAYKFFITEKSEL